MPLGPKTEQYFEKLKKEAQENPTTPFWQLPDIGTVRETCMPGFKELATDFPEEVSENDFVSHDLNLKSGKKISIQVYNP